MFSRFKRFDKKSIIKTNKPFKRLLQLLDSIFTDLNLRQTEHQITALPLARIRLSERVTQLLNQRLALLVTLNKREQISHNRPERLLRDLPLRQRIRLTRRSHTATATTQLTNNIRHGIVNNQAVVPLRQLLEERLRHAADLLVRIYGAQRDLVDLTARLYHLLEDQVRQHADRIHPHHVGLGIAQRQVQVTRPRLQRVREPIDQVADADDQLRPDQRIRRLLDEREQQLHVLSAHGLRQEHDLDQGQSARQLQSLVVVLERLLKDVHNGGQKLGYQAAAVGLTQLLVDQALHKHQLGVFGLGAVVQAHLLLQAGVLATQRLALVVGELGLGRLLVLLLLGVVVLAHFAALDLGDEGLVEEDEELGGEDAQVGEEARHLGGVGCVCGRVAGGRVAGWLGLRWFVEEGHWWEMGGGALSEGFQWREFVDQLECDCFC